MLNFMKGLLARPRANSQAPSAQSTRSEAIENRLRGDYAQVEVERSAAISANSDLEYAESDVEAAERFAKFRQRDPFPDVAPALLNSADIADYVCRTGMIYPFDASKLKSASYEVGILGEYVIVDSKGRPKAGVLQPGDSFTLPKNSIAYLSVEPKFRLPDYIALRHNLKIKNIYRGLLVGTGPLIDPGFVGRIALPLHNLTDRDYELEAGEGTIWVEFTKLSPSLRWQHPSAVPAPRNGSYVPFPSPPSRDRGPVQYVNEAVGPHQVPGSSTAEIARDARDAKRGARTAKFVSWSTLVATVVGVVALVAVPITLLQPRIEFLVGEIANLEDELESLKTDPAVGVPQPALPTATPAP